MVNVELYYNIQTSKEIDEEKMERGKADIGFSDHQNSFEAGKQAAATLKKNCIQKIHINI